MKVESVWRFSVTTFEDVLSHVRLNTKVSSSRSLSSIIDAEIQQATEVRSFKFPQFVNSIDHNHDRGVLKFVDYLRRS